MDPLLSNPAGTNDDADHNEYDPRDVADPYDTDDDYHPNFDPEYDNDRY